ncbi:hypothetical protein J3R83DRAFT_12238 [Lanmaoa asiatica]|nr:hypothetical protein J3R83DRAFT_12238 [Lanmaoa asiatica]
MESVLSFDQPSDELHSGLIPEIVVLPEPATSSPALPELPASPSPGASSENIVTVEKFLRCSVQTVPKTKQVVPGSVAVRRSRAYIRQHPAERQITPARKVLKVPKQLRGSSRIAKTLFRAAVLTDGDPLDTLVDGAGISSHTAPFEICAFQQIREALWTWPDWFSRVPLVPGKMQCCIHNASATPRISKHCHHHPSSSHPRTPKLCLVPLREAEAAYSVIFP